MRHKLALLFTMLVVVLLASLGPLGPAGADDDDDDDDDPPTAYPLTSFPPSDSDNVVLQWNNEALECIRAGQDLARWSTPAPCSSSTAPPTTPGRPMTPRPRAPGWAAPCAGPRSERTTANKSQAISHAAYRAASWVWPGCQASWDAQLEALGYTAADATTAATVGRTAADAVIAHRGNDGSNQANNYADTSGYQPVNPPAPAPLVDPWRWQPQTSRRRRGPHWRHVHPVQPQRASRHPGPEPAQVGVADGRQHAHGERRPQRPQEEHGRLLGRRPRVGDPARATGT